jgi:hypothetical protein
VKPACLLGSLLLLALRGEAQFIYEPFNYEITPSGINGHGGWASDGNTDLIAGNLNVPAEPPAPVGNSVQARVGANAKLRFSSVITDGSIYFSYAFRLDFVGTFPSIIKAKDSFSLLDENGSFSTRVEIIPTSLQTYQIGLRAQSSVIATNPGSFNQGDTIFIVGSYSFKPGAPDTSSLWVNPDPGTLGAATPPPASIADFALSRDVSQITGVDLSCNAQLGRYTVDEMRFGTNWQDVTPVPEPSVPRQLLSGGTAALLLWRRRAA